AGKEDCVKNKKRLRRLCFLQNFGLAFRYPAHRLGGCDPRHQHPSLEVPVCADNISILFHMFVVKLAYFLVFIGVYRLSFTLFVVISVYRFSLFFIGVHMKLLDSNEVCELLGISKSTLYRWCGVSEDFSGLGLSSGLPQANATQNSLGRENRLVRRELQQNALGVEETPSDFPRPFKIGRSFKWKDAEIMAWLETRRV
ncbi:helix-turn-helix domain-containing protein, partial [Escherichia coli]